MVFSFDGIDRRNKTSISFGTVNEVIKLLHVVEDRSSEVAKFTRLE